MASSGIPDRPVATSSSALWGLIVTRGGLQPKRARARGPGYDEAFVREVARTLDLADWLPIRWELVRKCVPIEALLTAVLTAAQPWARMMTDIIAMLEVAGADHGGDGIRLELRFDRLAPHLAESLSSFRTQAERAQRVTSLTPGSQWGTLNPYQLHPGDQYNRLRDRTPTGAGRTPILAWARRYIEQVSDQPGGRDDPPKFSPSGVPNLDRELRRLHRFMVSLIAAVRELGPTYNSRLARRRDEDRRFADGWDAASVAGAESDFALVSLAEIFEQLALRAGEDPARSRVVAAELQAKLDRAPSGPSAQSISRQLLDLLDLPAWQRRHELYSVWISSIIATALPAPSIWSLVDGTLSYSFGGSELAHGPLGSGAWALWAELRRPLPNPVSRKRRKAVQPDYTLLAGADSQEAAAALVVECKQYRVPSRRNFREALTDYARAHPDSHVLLANYGHVSKDVDKNLGGKETRVAAFGEVHPRGSGMLPFTNAIAEAVAAMTERVDLESAIQSASAEEANRLAGPTRMVDNVVNGRSVAPSNSSAVAEVWLQWHNGADLDLYAHYRGKEGAHVVYHGACGSLEELPWLQLDQDVLQGPGLETISIGRLMPGHYEFEVRLHAGEWPDSFGIGLVRPGHARIRTVYPGPERSMRVFELEQSESAASH